MHVGEIPSAGQVHVPGPARRAGRGLIGMHRRGGLQQLLHPVREGRLRQPGGPAADADAVIHQYAYPRLGPVARSGYVQDRAQMPAQAPGRGLPGQQAADAG